jgi:hypothetical protein
MISNLYGGSWHSIALNIAKAIKNPNVRILCENLLQNMAKTLVSRPACGDWPGDDGIAWGREAIESHGKEPIERIVASRPAYEVLSKACRFIRCIDEVNDSGFWRDVTSAWSQTLKIADQVQALRKLCVHSEFLCLVTPHVYGGSDDETDFAHALIRSALRRPTDFLTPEIEIHTEAPSNPAASDYAQRLRNLTQNISNSLRTVLAPGQKVELVLWPKLLDRYLLAGVYAEMSDGKRSRSPRWGISMQHIARKADERTTSPPTPWALLTRSQLSDEFDRYCKAGVGGFTTRVDIVG